MAKRRLNIRRIINQSNRLLLSYERKYSKQIASALREQLNHYADTEVFIDTITPTIEDLYRSVTERYFIMQYTILEESLQKSIFMDTFRAWFEVYLKTQLAKKVTNINETTLMRLQQVLTPFIKGSFEWDEAVKALSKAFDFSARRALMIARTEIGNANNVGKKQSSDEWAMQGSGAQYKIWIHRGAKTPRDWHMQLDNGKAIPSEMPFIVTDPITGTTDAMDTPHDASASAGNVINCGCEVLYVSERYARENNMI